MNWRWPNSKKKETEQVDASLELEHTPSVKILVGNKHIATIYREGSGFCLTYCPAFLDSGIAPFNPNDFPKNVKATPEIDKIYRAPVLWECFAARLPSKNRDDYATLMSSMGLTGDEDPLIILGKVGKVSIAKPWKLELIVSKVS